MKQILIKLYTLVLSFYPRQFHTEFGDEMVDVFFETITGRSGSQSVIQFLRELRDLPGSLLDAFTANWFRGSKMSTKNKYVVRSTHWQSFIGTLPFLAYGIVKMVDEMDLYGAPRFTYAYLGFYGLALTGLLIGWIRLFPLWSYSYLGWSLVFAWWWTGIRIYGTNWGYRVWLPFGIMVLLALLWTRSLEPIKRLLRDIWNDWARLTLAMFALGAWIFVGFDEIHNSKVVLFILTPTLVDCAGAWFFLRSSSLIRRVLSIAVSFIVSAVLVGISYLTWDWRAYYGLPPAESWNDNLGVAPIGVLFWLLILFWPALIALIHRIAIRRVADP